MKLLRIVLFPFSWLFMAIMEARNFLYDKGLLRTIHFDVPVVSVGNLTVGGTGKTPMVEMLAAQMADRVRIALLSRGYRRKTRGFRLAGEEDNADTIGDEPYQYRLKFGSETVVAVGEDRALAIPEILLRHPETQLLILDDAFQHRSVYRDVNILLVDYNRPIDKDHLLPAGRLRERKSSAGRANVVVVTKCPPDMSDHEKHQLQNRLRRYLREDCPLFFSHIQYLPLRPVFGAEHNVACAGKVVFFSGIASDRQPVSYLSEQYDVVQVIRFPDHYRYTPGVLRRRILEPVGRLGSEGICLVTTEKDMARIHSVRKSESLFSGVPLYYVPIEFRMFGEENRFIACINSKLNQQLVSN
jgi:tetraacyldisaccharide 4'-kinase